MRTAQSISVNGRRLHVETSGPGDGQAVVLLHHGLGSVQAWKAQIPFLSGAGFRVIAYDRWGYGKSDFRAGIDMPVFQDDLADLLALLETFEIEQAALVGHSDGGTIALYFAAQHPERVSRMAVVAAHIYVEPKMEPGIEQVREAYEQEGPLRAGLSRVHGDQHGQVFSNWYDGWRQEQNLAWDMRPILQNVRCPVLVVQGEADEHATHQHARDLAEAIPHSELWLAPGAHHMLPQEQPETFNERLLSFLKRDFGSLGIAVRFLKRDE